MASVEINFENWLRDNVHSAIYGRENVVTVYKASDLRDMLHAAYLAGYERAKQ